MKRFRKREIMLTISAIILLFICCTGLYLLSRSIHVNNNDLLLIYETLEPVSVKEDNANHLIDMNYTFGEDIGRVIVKNDGEEVVICDYNKHGFIKSYRNGVLYYVYDLKKEGLFGEIKSYFNPKFWFGGGREVVESTGTFIRTADECRQIGQLLKEKKHSQIAEDKRNKIIVTNSGTYFIN